MKNINVLFLFLLIITATYSSPTMAVAMPKPGASAKPTFEFGIRDWISVGSVNYKKNISSYKPRYGPGYGNPTSTIDLEDITGLSLEGFFRYNYRNGLYIKSLAGISKTVGGILTDQDFSAGQIKDSDTSSTIVPGKMMYAGADLGFGHHIATGSRIGIFAGAQIWRDKLTATGLYYANTGVPDTESFTPGHISHYGVPVFIYEPHWYLLRLGVDGKLVAHKWSLEGEVVWVPIAGLINYDSHLLRTNPNDLGPAPNVISRSISGRGFQLESFVNYALTSKNEISIGVRYWRLSTNNGFVGRWRVLAEFSETRFGALVQFKHKF